MKVKDAEVAELGTKLDRWIKQQEKINETTAPLKEELRKLKVHVLSQDAKISSQGAESLLQKATISSQGADILSQNATISSQGTDILSQKATISSQGADILSQNAKISSLQNRVFLIDVRNLLDYVRLDMITPSPSWSAFASAVHLKSAIRRAVATNMKKQGIHRWDDLWAQSEFLELLFPKSSGELRQEGNTAVHTTPLDAIAEAVPAFSGTDKSKELLLEALQILRSIPNDETRWASAIPNSQ
jgi:hypothetical protein